MIHRFSVSIIKLQRNKKYTCRPLLYIILTNRIPPSACKPRSGSDHLAVKHVLRLQYK